MSDSLIITGDGYQNRVDHPNHYNMSNTTYANSFSHGSEEGIPSTADPIDVEPSPEASVGTSPLSSQGDALEHMDARYLQEYLLKITRDAKTVEQVIKTTQINNGVEWVKLLTCVAESETLLMLKEECDITNRISSMRLIRDAKSARQRMDHQDQWNAERNQLVDEIATSREQHVNEINQMTDAVNAATGTGTTAGTGLPNLDNVRLDDMPKIPKGQNSEKMLSPHQLERYKVSITSFIQARSDTIVSMADQLIQDYTVDIDTILANVSPMERRFDTRLGGKLYADAPSAI